MNRSRLWIIIVVLLLLVNTAVLAMLWFKRPPHDQPQGGSAKEFLIHELNLTADQQKKFDDLREEHQKQTRAIMEGMRDLKDGLADKISAPQNDSAAINDLTKQIAEKERQRDLATIYHFRSFRTILNTEQQEKFDKILKDVLRMLNNQPRPQGPPHPPGRERGERPPGDSGEMPPHGDGHEPH